MPLLDTESFSKNKIAFIGIAAVLVIALLYGVSMLSSASNKPKTHAPKELSVWVVGDETAGFSDIISGFKKRYPEYNGTDIKFTKFGNYADYEKTLLSVISDGNSPDIFVVNNNGGTLLESKILGIPASVVNPDEFSKNFHKVFDDLVVSSKEKDTSGNELTVSGLKGIPMGYETLGIFYNWKLVRNVPRLWNQIGERSGTEDGSTEDMPSYLDMMLGLSGKYILSAPDILSLLMLQNGIDSVDKLSDPVGIKAYGTYNTLSGAIDPGVYTSIRSEMEELNLSTVDMFVRGNIGMIIGFPSLLREIEYSIKRAASASVLSPKFLRTSDIPQISNDPGKGINLADYNYFALSKTSNNTEAGYAFLAYLSSREAEGKYLEKFPTYLPAQRIFEEQRINESVSREYERVKYRSFMNPEIELQSFDKGLKNEFEAYFSSVLGNTKVDAKDILSGAMEYIGCNKKHFIDFTALDEICKIRY